MEKFYSELKEIAENELKKLAKKGDLSANEVEAAKNAVSLIEKINKICNWNMSEEDYSRREDPYRRWEILSYGDRHMMPKPSMMEDSYRTRGYSRHSIKDRAISKLEGMMDEAGSDYERDKVREFIRHIENVE